jgi:signal transduction histidine kinase
VPDRLFRHFVEFHSYGPPRLRYIGWVGVAGYGLFYFFRFTRSNYAADDDLVLRACVLVLFLGTAMRESWPEGLKRYYFAWAYVTLLVGLPFFNVYTGLERGGGIPAISNCFIAIALLALIVDWRNLVAMLVLGTVSAWVVFRLRNPGAPVPRDLLAQLPAFLLIAVGSYVFKYSTEQVDNERKLREEQHANERRLAALVDTLAFMAHELNTPLATVRTAASVLRTRRETGAPDVAQFAERSPGEIAALVDRMDRAAVYCQTLVTSFVQSARAVASNPTSFDGSARGLLDSLLAEYPFAAHERAWVSCSVEQDFSITGRRDLFYLVLCTLVNNGLHALRSATQPRLEIVAGVHDEAGDRRGWIRVSDAGKGIPEPLLAKLTREPFTTKASDGGTGMGLVFCRRVMESMGGNITIRSRPGEGTTILLEFDPARVPA